MAASIAVPLLSLSIHSPFVSSARNQVNKNELLAIKTTSATRRNRGSFCSTPSDRGVLEHVTSAVEADPGITKAALCPDHRQKSLIAEDADLTFDRGSSGDEMEYAGGMV